MTEISPAFAEAMLRVLNNNAEQMARHIGTGRAVVLEALPNPLDYQQGEEMSLMDQTAGPAGPPPTLEQLVAREHNLKVSVQVTFLAPDDYIEDATQRTIGDELNQHIAHALRSRGMGVLGVGEFFVEFT